MPPQFVRISINLSGGSISWQSIVSRVLNVVDILVIDNITKDYYLEIPLSAANCMINLGNNFSCFFSFPHAHMQYMPLSFYATKLAAFLLFFFFLGIVFFCILYFRNCTEF